MAIAAEGTFFSTNNGDTWVQTTNSGLYTVKQPYPYSPDEYICTPNWVPPIRNPISGSIFYGGHRGIFRLSKDGKFWENFLEFSQRNINEIATDVRDILVTVSGDIYAAAYGGSYLDDNGSIIRIEDDAGLYYSSDNGDTWVNKRKGFNIYSLALAPDGVHCMLPVDL